MEVKKFFQTTQSSVIEAFNFLPTHASVIGENPMKPNSAKDIFAFSGTNRCCLPKSPLPLAKTKAFATKPVTIFYKTKTRDDLKEDKIYFTLGHVDKRPDSPKKAPRIIKIKLANVDVDLSMIQKLYAVDVTLDPNTAYPKLILSKDGKQVNYDGTWRDVPNNPERFDCSACVLGMDGFSCGRFYFEVQVGDKPEWDIGVAKESIKKKGEIKVSPVNGFWTIWLRNDQEYMANESSPISLCVHQKPQKVGVFVDYEEGLVSFYNVDTKSLIYSFTGQSFTEKLHPFLSPCNNRGNVNTKPLIITTDLQGSY